MTHVGYIAAAYGASALVMLGMIGWVSADLAIQRRKLRRLEDEGVRRRSEVRR
jgi:heme exporter protein D